MYVHTLHTMAEWKGQADNIYAKRHTETSIALQDMYVYIYIFLIFIF